MAVASGQEGSPESVECRAFSMHADRARAPHGIGSVGRPPRWEGSSPVPGSTLLGGYSASELPEQVRDTPLGLCLRSLRQQE